MRKKASKNTAIEEITEDIQPSPPEFHLIIPEFNSQGRLCNYHTGENAEVKVMPDEWERFNQLAGRQHKIIDGVVTYDETLEPCMPDELVASELHEVEQRLLEILDQERLDEICGTKSEAVPFATFGFSEKQMLITERNRLLQLRS